MKYFLIVASKDHVALGVKGNFAQAGHGKKTQLQKLKKGDGIIFYSSKLKIDDSKPYQKFTAYGKVADDAPFQVKVSADFMPWRRKIDFELCNDLEIRPLIDQLEFITNKKRWGFPLMRGFLELSENDFELISQRMI